MAAGRHLSELARAIDDRPVVPEQEAKSIGHEETFATDLWDPDDLHRRLQRMVDASATALRRADRAARTVTVKLRFGDFTQITRSHTLDGPVDATPAIGAVAAALLDERRPGAGASACWVSACPGLSDPGGGTQLRLDLDEPSAGSPTAGDRPSEATDGPAAGDVRARGGRRDALQEDGRAAARLQETWGSVTAAVDAIRARYGGEAVGPGVPGHAGGAAGPPRGEAQWGPDGDPTGSGRVTEAGRTRCPAGRRPADPP